MGVGGWRPEKEAGEDLLDKPGLHQAAAGC